MARLLDAIFLVYVLYSQAVSLQSGNKKENDDTQGIFRCKPSETLAEGRFSTRSLLIYLVLADPISSGRLVIKSLVASSAQNNQYLLSATINGASQ